MSWGTCLSGSNNIHFDFPPLMSDGRNFSNWDAACKVNEDIQVNANIKSNWNYRNYLTNNAEKIMLLNKISACDNCCSCWNQYKTGHISTKNKYLYSSCIDDKQPFGYEGSDLKDIYLSRQQLNSQLRAPIVTQEEYLRQRVISSKSA